MRISDIIRADFRSIISNTSALLVCAVLALLPSAYAWFNIIASWDPYSNTANLKVAIASEDQGVTSLGHHINIGDQVLENLKDNTQMGWIFTDPTTATSGVKYGDYYASVVIGSGFSADMMSFLSHEPKKPTLHYTVNEKINAMSQKLLKRGWKESRHRSSQHFLALSMNRFFLKQIVEVRSSPVCERISKKLDP